MKIWELAEKYHFKDAERNRLKKYISNQFADARQMQNIEKAFLEKWQKIIGGEIL